MCVWSESMTLEKNVSSSKFLSSYLIQPVQEYSSHPWLKIGVVVKHTRVFLGTGFPVTLAHTVPYIIRICPREARQGALAFGQIRAGRLVGAAR